MGKFDPNAFWVDQGRYTRSISLRHNRYQLEFWRSWDDQGWSLFVHHDYQPDYKREAEWEYDCLAANMLPEHTSNDFLKQWLWDAMSLFIEGVGITDPDSIEYINQD